MMDDPVTEAALESILEKARQMRVAKSAEGDGMGPPRPPLKPRDSGGTSSPMENRVTALEIHMEYVQRDLTSIVNKLDTVITQTADLPTKRDLSTFRWQWIATAAAAFAIIVGSIIGGLSWIKPDASPPSPIVVQMPATVTVPPATGGQVGLPHSSQRSR